MRIISPFKDYYDCIQSYYRDEMIYIRKTELVTKDGIPDYFHSFNWYGIHSILKKTRKILDNYTYKFGPTIGFCGKTYEPIIIRKITDSYLGTQEEVICYSKQTVLNKFPDIAYDIFDYFSKVYKFDVFNNIPENKKQDNQKFLEKRCPIFLDFGDKIEYNGSLKEWSFQKVFPPAQAYQELMMYFSSILAAPEKPIPKIDDVTMAEAKGFNKYSFRKDKRV